MGLSTIVDDLCNLLFTIDCNRYTFNTKVVCIC